jgi:hypothetical protein
MVALNAPTSAVLFAVLCLVQGHMAAAGSILNPPGSNRQEWFLKTLQKLADQGGLHSPENVESTIGERIIQDGAATSIKSRFRNFGIGAKEEDALKSISENARGLLLQNIAV